MLSHVVNWKEFLAGLWWNHVVPIIPPAPEVAPILPDILYGRFEAETESEGLYILWEILLAFGELTIITRQEVIHVRLVPREE